MELILFIAAVLATFAAIAAAGTSRLSLNTRRVLAALFGAGAAAALYILWRRIEFVRPWWLLGMLAGVPMYLLSRWSRIPISPLRKRLALFMHVVILALLVAALAGIKSTTKSEKLCVVFLLDISRSVEQESIDAARAAIAGAAEDMTEKDSAALIVFGGEASMEIGYASKEDFKIGGVTSSVITRDFTDLSEAMRLAIACFPQDAQKRIVLVSDGNENSGAAVRSAIQAKSAGVDLQCVWLKGTTKEDLMVKRVIVPDVVIKDEKFDIRFAIESTYDTRADITILVNDREVAGGRLEDREIKQGENFFMRKVRLPEARLHRIKVKVRDRLKTARNETDDVINNNQYETFVKVLGKSSRVLYIEGGGPKAKEESESGSSSPERSPEEFLRDALLKSKIEVDVVGPEGIPQKMAEYEQYDAVIISDTAARCFEANNVMEKIRAYVRDMGGGLIMVGGENSFALGNYTDTPIEDALPVNCDIREQYYLASVAIAVVIDRSGSMMAPAGGGRTKLRLATEGVVATVNRLKGRDKLGVLFVDTTTMWLPTIREIGSSKQAIISNVRGAQPGGGGILVRTGLKEAYVELKRTSANVKHIILFADADDAEELHGTMQLARQGRRQQPSITLSVIGLGTAGSKDAGFLKKLAEDAGKGRFHLVSDARKLPSLFVKDALLATKSYLIEKDFQPIVKSGFEPALKGTGIGDLAPKLHGYVSVSKKDAATVSMISPFKTRDPILARWQYGLGRSAAFTSDCKNRWSEHWLNERSEFYHKFWGQLVKSIMRSPFPSMYSSRMCFDRQTGRIEVEALDEGEYVNYLDLKARVVLPDGNTLEVNLPQQGPGVYRGEFNAEQVGGYFAVIVEGKSGRPIGKMQRSIPYSPEYMKTGGNPHLLQSMASAAGGRYHGSLGDVAGENLFSHDNVERKTYHEVWQTLLLAAMVLLIVEVAVRRLSLPQFLAEGSRPGRKAPSKPMLGELLKRKQQRREEEKKAGEVIDLGEFIAPADRVVMGVPIDEELGTRMNERQVDTEPSSETLDRLLRIKNKRRREQP